MGSKSFPFSFDIAGRYAKHREQDYLRYGKRGKKKTEFKEKTMK